MAACTRRAVPVSDRSAQPQRRVKSNAFRYCCINSPSKYYICQPQTNAECNNMISAAVAKKVRLFASQSRFVLFGDYFNIHLTL